MRSIRILAFVLLLSLAILSSGCTNTWSVVFDDVQDILDWSSTALGDEPSSSVTSEGLIINGMRIQAPFIFTGDCMIIVQFDMSCDMMNDIGEFAILLTNYLSDGEVLAFHLENYCTVLSRSYTVIENDTAVAYEYSTTVDLNVNTTGGNEFVIKRDRERVVLSLNGEIFYNEAPGSNYQDYAYPGFLVDINSGSAAKIAIKSIIVQYSGEKIPI